MLAPRQWSPLPKPPPRQKAKKGRFKAIRKVSSRRAAQLREYAKMLPAWKERHPVCEVCPVINAAGFNVKCLGKTDHPHHVKGRIGKLLTDERYLLACCGGESHPSFIHFTNKADAIALGLLV